MCYRKHLHCVAVLHYSGIKYDPGRVGLCNTLDFTFVNKNAEQECNRLPFPNLPILIHHKCPVDSHSASAVDVSLCLQISVTVELLAVSGLPIPCGPTE